MLQPNLPQSNPSMDMPTEGATPSAMPIGMQEDDNADIIQNLEEHLNSLPEEYKVYLADVLSNQEISVPVLNVLGIVAGKEVYDYFAEAVASLLPQESVPSAQDTMAAPQSSQPILNQPTKDTSTVQGPLAPSM